ncbi:hypothetical protein [Paenibacillus dauci]|uniref:hypothetical protein n=1 Tax=Paenibacillus dauci TaxID=1567106 RepID=UPI0006198CAD|nr:hypothetical protein [Paenibacillus dauci]
MMKSLTMSAAAALLLSGVLAGCSDTQGSKSNDPTSAAQSASESKPDDTGQDNSNPQTTETDYRQYSSDPNKSNPDSDYNVVGKYVAENEDTMTLDVNGKQLIIPKSNSYEPASALPPSTDLPGQQISVTLSAQDGSITVAQPADKADNADNSQQDIVGMYVSQTDTQVVIKQGEKEMTYTKSAQYEAQKDPDNEKLEGTTVRLDLDKDGNVLRIRTQYQDGSTVGD